MGEVFRARDEHLDRDVAIKVLPPRTFSDDSTRKHFRKEALALSRLDHPNIATIHDSVMAGDFRGSLRRYAKRRSGEERKARGWTRLFLQVVGYAGAC